MAEIYRHQIVPANISTEEEAAKGKRYRLYRDEDGKQVQVTRFDDQEEMLEAMSRPEYQNDGVYRATVQDLITASVGVEGVDPSLSQSFNRGEVDFIEASRKEALRAHAAAMHEKLGSSDPRVKWEAIEWMMKNPEAVHLASDVYGAPQGEATNNMFRPGPTAHREQLESGSVSEPNHAKVSAPLSSEHADLINTLSQKHSQ